MLAGRGASRERALRLAARPRRGRRSRRTPPTDGDLARFEQAVREHGGSVEDAARALGLSRATLYRRLKVARGRSAADS